MCARPRRWKKLLSVSFPEVDVGIGLASEIATASSETGAEATLDGSGAGGELPADPDATAAKAETKGAAAPAGTALDAYVAIHTPKRPAAEPRRSRC